MMRELGYYWVITKDNVEYGPQVAAYGRHWSGAYHWYLVATDWPYSDAEVAVISDRLAIPWEPVK